MWQKNTPRTQTVGNLGEPVHAQWYRWLELSVWLLKHKKKGKNQKVIIMC